MTYGMEGVSTASPAATDPAVAGILMVIIAIVFAISLALGAIMIISMWRLYTKAGRPGWASIVPFYNQIVMIKIIGRPLWWFAMMFVPFANIVFSVMIMLEFVKSYGKDTWFGVASLFFPYVIFPIMAFDKNIRYVGPAGLQPPVAATAATPSVG
jgi:hypothetical protein